MMEDHDILLGRASKAHWPPTYSPLAPKMGAHFSWRGYGGGSRMAMAPPPPHASPQHLPPHRQLQERIGALQQGAGVDDEAADPYRERICDKRKYRKHTMKVGGCSAAAPATAAADAAAASAAHCCCPTNPTNAYKT